MCVPRLDLLQLELAGLVGLHRCSRCQCHLVLWSCERAAARALCAPPATLTDVRLLAVAWADEAGELHDEALSSIAVLLGEDVDRVRATALMLVG